MPDRDNITRTHQVLAVPKRVELLELLRAGPDLVTVSEAAKAVDLHPNTARVHLERLAEVGLAARVIETRSSPGRPKVLYRAVVTGGAAQQSPDDYETLARLLAESLDTITDPVAAAELAGKRWAEALDERDWPATPTTADVARTTLVALMAELGFAPSEGPSPDQIDLHRCPFAAVARDHRSVVCGMHLAMIRTTLHRLGDSVRATSLSSFVEDDPLMCRIELMQEPHGYAEPTGSDGSPDVELKEGR